jgi:eukaryotic-like serine/threonine-protein kinase
MYTSSANEFTTFRTTCIVIDPDGLENLESRRIDRNKIEIAERRVQEAERKLSDARARRPWILVAVVVLVLGLAASLVLYRRAVHERDIANRQTALANAVNHFLANDLLGRSNPFQSGKAEESLTDAVKRASPAIDRQFANEPEVAAKLHQTIARALDARTDYAGAHAEYDRAASLFLQSEGPLSENAIIVQLQLAGLLARSYQGGTLDLAKSILAEQESKISRIPKPSNELLTWLYSARGMIALIGNDAKAARDNFQIALEKASTVADFDENTRLAFKQRLGFANIRLGNGVEAERIFRELIAAYSKTTGSESAEALRVHLNLAQAFMIQNKNAEAVDETNRIYPGFVAKLGPDHELTMQVLATRAQCEGALERWEDATRDGLQLHQLAVQKQGASSFFAIAPLSDASLAQCRGGHVAEGATNARTAYEESRKAFGEHAGLTGASAEVLAECLIDRNQFDEAAKLLDGIDIKAVSQLTGIADWSATVDLDRAEIAYGHGDYAAARKDIQPAIAVFSRADAEPYQKHKLETLLSSLERHTPRSSQ